MKTFKTSIYLALVMILTLGTACSSDDDNNNPNQPGASGEPHKYDITIDGQRFSGEIDNVSPYTGDTGENGAGPAMSYVVNDEGMTSILFGLKDNDMDVSAGFTYPIGQGDAIPFDSDATILIIPSNGIGYNSNTGTAKVILGESTNLPGGLGQFTAMKIEFDGRFGYYDQDDNPKTATISGYFTANLPEGGF